MENNQNEIYSIDFCTSSSNIIYSGNDLKCTIYNTITNSIVFIIEELSDSTIYCKFITANLVLVCLIDGTIILTNLDGSYFSNTKLNEEIALVKIFNNFLYVGTYTGTIYKIDLQNLNHQMVFMGHSSEILEIHYYSDFIYSLSELSLLIFKNTGDLLYKINTKEAITFSMIPNTEIFCICTLSEILIYKKNILLKKLTIDGQPEVCVYTEGYFIIGGYCDYLLLINTQNNMSTYRFNLVSSGITKIIPEKYQLYFATACGFVGVCDIRQDESIKIYESKVETVFDFYYCGNVFYIGGFKGLDILNTTEFH